MKKEALSFIKKLIILALPIVLQQLFLNLASLVDNLMVGQLSEIDVSGVYVATQIIFVVNLMLFGAIEGSTIFFCQFYGIKDEENMKKVFSYKIIFSLIISVIAIFIIKLCSIPLIKLFTDVEAEIQIAKGYLDIVVFSIIPFALSNTIASTFRELHKPLLPMIVTFIGVFVNIFFNYIFIFGKCGIPQLNALGAAYGTLIDRLFEVIILICLVLFSKDKFIKNIYKNVKFDKVLFDKVLLKSIPLFINEAIWSISQTILIYVFTTCDGQATTVLPIVQTIYNLLFVVMLGLANAISIQIGNTIGEGNMKKAQNEAYYSLITTLIICIFLGAILFIFSGFIVKLYKGVSPSSQELAKLFIRYNFIIVIINGLNTTLFFLLRAGGRTIIVFFFDSFYGYIISIPWAFILLYCTNLSLRDMYPLVYFIDIIKTIIGMMLLFSKKWHRRLVH